MRCVTAAPPPPTPRLRRLGIHGPRQSGKTCYLTVLHRYRKTGEAGVVLRDDATLAYLQELWNRYLGAGFPTPRTAGLPTEIRLDVQSAGRTWEVQTRDYPVVLASVMLGSGLVVLGGVIADLLYAAVDPRLRHA